MKTLRPQSSDIPMDWVVTERATYQRDPEGLVFLGEGKDWPRRVAGADRLTWPGV